MVTTKPAKIQITKKLKDIVNAFYYYFSKNTEPASENNTVTTKPAKIQITKKLEDILNTFNKEVFNKNKKIFVETKDLGLLNELAFLLALLFGGYYVSAFYQDKKIYIEPIYLDYILRNDRYKNDPELIKSLMGTLLHENIHAILDADPEKEEVKKNIIVHEGLATLVEDLYKTIVSEYKIDTNNSLEEILDKISKYVIEKFKDKEYLRNLEEELRKKFKEEMTKSLEEMLKNYNKCIDISYTSPEILDLGLGIKYYVLYKIPSLILQKNPGILKILEDLSSKKFPVDKYKEIILKEYKNLEGKDLIKNTLECIRDKLDKNTPFYFELLESEL
ncbi:MAG: hypothetical protein QW648_04020 [Nanoarchaeales archaeon]